MSYLIIFETKIVKLSDGRIIHFDLSGCNNDTCGRSRDDFSAKIYTVDEFIAKAERFKSGSEPYKTGDCWNMKIGSRYCSMYDYGEHLLRMLKRAEDYAEFIKHRNFEVCKLTGVSFYNPKTEQYEDMTFDEFDKYLDTVKPTSYQYGINKEYIPIQNEAEIAYMIDNNIPMDIYIGKKW